MKKALKLVAIVFAVVIVVFAGVGVFLPSSFDGTITQSVSAPADKMVQLLATPRSWLNWSPWNTKAMPGMESSYSGPESGVGAHWSWTQEQGNGSLTVSEYEPSKQISYKLTFEGMNHPMTGNVVFSADGDNVKVAWSYKGKMGSNLMFRWAMLFVGDAMDDEYKKAIDGLAMAALKN
ncbi:MAG TPA: hypothetical protein EYN66_20515 [Myxococcales bacterium]|nr:hypothetical protein [Myxococcales bacterium]